MLVSPVNNIIIKLPFYNKWLADTFNGLSGHQLRFPVKSCFGFGLRFVNTILPIRFDLGYGDDLILHFNVSHTF